MKKLIFFCFCFSIVGCGHQRPVVSTLPSPPSPPGISEAERHTVIAEVLTDAANNTCVPPELFIAVLADVDRLDNEKVTDPPYKQDRMQLLEDLRSLRYTVRTRSMWSTI